MAWYSYTQIVNETAEVEVAPIKSHWCGEPTMNPRLVDMGRYAKEKNILGVMINTNALRLDENFSQDLIKV